MDQANKTNVDTQKTIKRTMEQIKELQMQIEEEQRNREEFRENYLSAEKRLAIVQAEKEDILLSIQQV